MKKKTRLTKQSICQKIVHYYYQLPAKIDGHLQPGKSQTWHRKLRLERACFQIES